MALDAGQHHSLAALPLGKTQDHCTGGWVGIKASLNGHTKSHPPTGIQSPDRPAHSDLLY